MTLYYTIEGPSSESRVGYGTKMMVWWQTPQLNNRAKRWSQILQKEQALLLDYASDKRAADKILKVSSLRWENGPFENADKKYSTFN